MDNWFTAFMTCDPILSSRPWALCKAKRMPNLIWTKYGVTIGGLRECGDVAKTLASFLNSLVRMNLRQRSTLPGLSIVGKVAKSFGFDNQETQKNHWSRHDQPERRATSEMLIPIMKMK